jgi:hypothetical protein
MDAAGVGALLAGAAAMIGATAQLVREVRRNKPPPASKDAEEEASGDESGLS